MNTYKLFIYLTPERGFSFKFETLDDAVFIGHGALLRGAHSYIVFFEDAPVASGNRCRCHECNVVKYYQGA